MKFIKKVGTETIDYDTLEDLFIAKGDSLKYLPIEVIKCIEEEWLSDEITEDILDELRTHLIIMSKEEYKGLSISFDKPIVLDGLVYTLKKPLTDIALEMCPTITLDDLIDDLKKIYGHTIEFKDMSFRELMAFLSYHYTRPKEQLLYKIGYTIIDIYAGVVYIKY